ncbi:MAG: HAD family hydrolase [Candidatus Aenigmarchaeota archaeon]|nr:HAD family hydrolase [Candidatus Aenigmarchaeota archaeon]
MPRSPRFRYLVYLFDADGPLINSVDAAFGTTNRVLESFDLEPLDIETWRQRNKSPRNLYTSSGVPKDGLAEAVNRYQLFFNELKSTTTSPLEVETTLRALSKRHVGIVTDMPRKDWEGYMLKFPSIGNHVQTVVTRDDCEERKPSPVPVLDAMRKMGFAKRKITDHEVRGIMVGDTANDIIAGRNAGLDTAALVYPGSYNNMERLRASEPTYLIPVLHAVTNMSELKNYQVNDSLFARKP